MGSGAPLCRRGLVVASTRPKLRNARLARLFASRAFNRSGWSSSCSSSSAEPPRGRPGSRHRCLPPGTPATLLPGTAPASTPAQPSLSEQKDGAWGHHPPRHRRPHVLLLALIYFCLKPARYAILLWGPKYINESIGSGMSESGLISGDVELAGPISVIVAGFVSDKIFGSRRMPVRSSACSYSASCSSPSIICPTTAGCWAAGFS